MKKKFHVAGYSTTGDAGIQLGQAMAFSPYPDQITHIPAFYAIDLRETDGHIFMNVSWYSVSKDVIEKTLYALTGYEDGQHMFNYFDRGMTEDITINEWIKTPSGREFQIDIKTPPRGVNILLK